MLTLESANHMLKAFGSEDACFDEQGCCSLVSSDSSAVHLKFDESSGTVVALADILDLSKHRELSGMISLTLLDANFMGRYAGFHSIALADDGETAVLQGRYNGLASDGSDLSLSDFVADFAETAAYLEAYFADAVRKLTVEYLEEEEMDENGMVVELEEDDQTEVLQNSADGGASAIMGV